MRKYEAIYILRTDTSESEVQALHTKLKGVVEEQFGGVELRFENWGKRKLSYEMKKNSKGVYFYHLFLGEGLLVQELQRHLRVSDLVLKFQTNLLEQMEQFAAEDIEKLKSTPSEIMASIQDDRRRDDSDSRPSRSSDRKDAPKPAAAAAPAAAPAPAVVAEPAAPVVAEPAAPAAVAPAE